MCMLAAQSRPAFCETMDYSSPGLLVICICCCSVTKSYLTLRPYGLQHARLPCPSQSPWACSNSCSLSQWCHPTISFSVIPFSSCPESFSASRSFPMSQLFTSSSQSIRAFSYSISPSNKYSGLISFRIDWLNRLAVQGTLKSLFQHHSPKASILRHSAFFVIQHDYWKNHSFD